MTPQKERFFQEYLVDFNGQQAAIRAGYSAKSARCQSSRLLVDPEIQAALSAWRQYAADRAQVSAAEVIAELKALGFSNMKDYVDEGNKPKDVSTMDRYLAAAVQEVSIEEKTYKGVTTVTRKIKLYDKLNALDKIARHLGFYEKDNLQGKTTITVGYDDDQSDDE